MAPSEWGGGGPGRLVDFTGGLPAAKAVPDTPLVAVRATTVRLSLRYSTYIRLKSPSTPRLTLYSYSLPPPSHPARRPGLCRGSARGGRANSWCTARARARASPFDILFIIVPKVRPPLILVAPMLRNRWRGRGEGSGYTPFPRCTVCATYAFPRLVRAHVHDTYVREIVYDSLYSCDVYTRLRLIYTLPDFVS